jgi:hypothetical protein
MLSMPTAVSEGPATGIAPPPRPSVWRVGWATFLGYLLTVLLGLPLALVMGGLGIDVVGNDGGGRGVFDRYDVWSWLAEGCVGLLATTLTAYFVGSQLRERTGWEVPFGFAFLTLLLTGYAPLLALTPFYGAAAPVSLVAATLTLRWRCEPSGAEPRKTLAAIPRRYRRGATIALAIVGPLMLAYVLAYGATHPLHSNSWSGDARTYEYEPGKLVRYDLPLTNDGLFQVTDLSVVRTEGTPALQVERVGIEANECVVPKGRETCEMALRPLNRFHPDPVFDRITLELRQGQVCPPGIAQLDAVWLRYTVLDMRHEQRIPLEQPPRVRCP